MPIPVFNHKPSPRPVSSLRLPAKRRLTLDASQRLSTITEASNPNAVPDKIATVMAPRSILRNSVTMLASPSRTAPPSYRSYDWVWEGMGDSFGDGEHRSENGREPVEGEKLARLRREGEEERSGRRGGWGRVALVALVLLMVLGLAIGLGVGLAARNRRHAARESDATSQPADTAPSQSSAQSFPLGEYSFVTALRSVQADCTSNPATWSCYPYTTTYTPSDPTTATSSRATFNWLLTNTSAIYASASSKPATTGSLGVPANLTISSTRNPFAITFANESLTYHSEADNSTSPRLAFSFAMTKNVVPSPAITPDNSQSECFFSRTIFTATLYLSTPRTFPSPDLANAQGIGGYQQWPFAVQMEQTSPGGQSTPMCYRTIDGGARDGIVSGLTPEDEESECVCRYGNF